MDSTTIKSPYFIVKPSGSTALLGCSRFYTDPADLTRFHLEKPMYFGQRPVSAAFPLSGGLDFAAWADREGIQSVMLASPPLVPAIQAHFQYVSFSAQLVFEPSHPGLTIERLTFVIPSNQDNPISIDADANSIVFQRLPKKEQPLNVRRT